MEITYTKHGDYYYPDLIYMRCLTSKKGRCSSNIIAYSSLLLFTAFEFIR